MHTGAKGRATGFAILAAALYALNAPLSKVMLKSVGPTMMAAFLYLGAGLGLMLYAVLSRAAGRAERGGRLTRRELPYTMAMVALDIAAPILLMFGMKMTNASTVSLLNNFEITATSLIALFIFKERVSGWLWLAIALITAASALLSLDGAEGLRFNAGSALVLGACVCWGFENNCTRKLSGKSTVEIVTIKGCFSGLGSLITALIIGESLPGVKMILAVMLLGFVAYGLSINFYILAQRHLGAAKTSAYYSIAPFLGAGFGVLFLGERPGTLFYPALLIMALSTLIMAWDTGEK